jgi:predicted phage-related endonuclease
MRSEYTADELPLKFTLQVQHQMAVTGAQNGWLFAMCGTEMILRHIPRHDRLIEGMHKHAEAFLKLVEANTPPEVDGSIATTRAITINAGEPKVGKIAKFPQEFATYAEELEALKEALDYDELYESYSELLKDADENVTGELLELYDSLYSESDGEPVYERDEMAATYKELNKQLDKAQGKIR